MKITEAKCLNCGAVLKVYEESKNGFCQSCGAEFITQDVINYYKMNLISSSEKDNRNFENLYRNGIDSWDAKDYEDAYNKFSKALEISPDDIKCSLYKSLCQAILKQNIRGATVTFRRLFAQLTFSDDNDRRLAGKFISYFNSICVNTVEITMKKYTPDVDGMQCIEYCWSLLEQCLEAQSFISSIFEKLADIHDEIKTDYITTLKNLLDTYDLLIGKWKRLMPSDYRYHVTEYHPQRDEFISWRNDLSLKIKELAPNTDDKKSKKLSSTKIKSIPREKLTLFIITLGALIFTLISRSFNIYYSSNSLWLGVLNSILGYLILIVSIGLIVANSIGLFKFDENILNKLEFITIITCLALNIIRVVLGIIATILVSFNLTFIALIFNLPFTIAYFVYRKKVLKNKN